MDWTEIHVALWVVRLYSLFHGTGLFQVIPRRRSLPSAGSSHGWYPGVGSHDYSRDDGGEEVGTLLLSCHQRIGPLILGRYLSRAFVLLPLFANVGGTLGPFMGGILADPVHNYPSLVWPEWMSRWPYALPSLVNAAMCALIAVLVVLCLDEVCPWWDVSWY